MEEIFNLHDNRRQNRGSGTNEGTSKKSSLLFWAVLTGLAILAVGFDIVPLRFLSTQMLVTILFVLGFSTCVLLVYFNEELGYIKNMGYIMTGAYIGAALNQFLSIAYLTNVFPFLLVDLFIVIVGLAIVFEVARKAKKPSEETRHAFRFERIRYVFLGISFISLVFASWFFYDLVQSYLSILPQAKAIGATINVDSSIIINVFKSLVLTGVFSFLERLFRIWEEAKRFMG